MTEPRGSQQPSSINEDVNNYVTFSGLFSRFTYGVIVFYFSNSFFSLLSTFDHTTEIALISILSLILWKFLDAVIRHFLQKEWLMGTNLTWKKLLVEMLNFISLIEATLVIQMVLAVFQQQWSEGNLSILENVVAIFTVLSITVVIYITMTQVLDRSRETVQK
jgi:hypothetical protein